MKHYFHYSEVELNYLKKKDKKLAQAIEQIGMIEREVYPDIFHALVHSIIGQQISTKAHHTVWQRLQNLLPLITPETLSACTIEQIQGLGMTFKKAQHISDIARMIATGEFCLDELHQLSDEELCAKLVKLNGIGVWTAEMLMIFSMQRTNILSYGDLAILRGLRMLYRHKKITRELFRKYHRRYAPYASVASIYLWAIAGGAIAGLSDPAHPARPVGPAKS